MDREQFRKAGYDAVDRVCDYFDSLEKEDTPVISSVEPNEIINQIPITAPSTGQAWDEIVGDFDKIILPGITAWQHPSFFAYFPANSTYESILADILVGAVSNPGFNWSCSPACTELEVVMCDWISRMLGLDDSWLNSGGVGGGVIMGSASESCLTVCVAARERALDALSTPNTTVAERSQLLTKFVIYGTDQTHSLGAKAALVLGIRFRALPTTASDDWGLRGETLRAALEEDEAAGVIPFILLATFGTTSSGATDNLLEITAVKKDYPNLFVHLDAAWSGVFLALTECRGDVLKALNGGGIDSFCTNMHKSGLITFDCSNLMIRNRNLLTNALDITPAYLKNKNSDAGTVVDYRNWTLFLGRRFRSLKIYFVLRSYGIEGVQSHLRKLIDLSKRFESLVVGEEGFELFVPRSLSLVVFRLIMKDSVDTESKEVLQDKLNRTFYRLISEDHTIQLTSTLLGSKFVIRIAVGSPRTTTFHVDKAWKTILAVAIAAKKEIEL